MDENKLGPFKQGDIANIPKEIVKILLNSDSVDLIEEN
jgi:hypothetical protein